MSGPDMSTDTVAKGLGAFLTEQLGRPIVASNLVSSSAGARRGNVLFDAHDGDTTFGLVATIIPSSARHRDQPDHRRGRHPRPGRGQRRAGAPHPRRVHRPVVRRWPLH